MSTPENSPLFCLDRRSFLACASGVLSFSLLGSASSGARAASLAELVLYGPPAGPSITLAHAAASGDLSMIADKVSFKVWRNPDEMRAGLTSGTMQAVVMPVQAAASLYNRGFGLKLLNVMTKGLLYVISTDAGVTGIPDLRGKRLTVPFRNDSPDIVLARLLVHYGLKVGSDITVETVGSPVEAIQLLLAGRTDAVLAPEPVITAAIIRAKESGKSIARVVDIQKVWGEVTKSQPVLPQAGLVLTNAFSKANPDVAGLLQDALQRAAAAVNADPQKAAANAASALELPAPVVAASIGTSNLVALRASAVRAEIESMLSAMSDADPALIGGRLPDDGFYG